MVKKTKKVMAKRTVLIVPIPNRRTGKGFHVLDLTSNRIISSHETKISAKKRLLLEDKKPISRGLVVVADIFEARIKGR